MGYLLDSLILLILEVQIVKRSRALIKVKIMGSLTGQDECIRISLEEINFIIFLLLKLEMFTNSA